MFSVCDTTKENKQKIAKSGGCWSITGVFFRRLLALMENVGTSRLLARSIIGVDLHESLDKEQLDPAIPV